MILLLRLSMHLAVRMFTDINSMSQSSHGLELAFDHEHAVVLFHSGLCS